MTGAPKDLERRVCRALGGQRAGNTGMSHSDCVGVPYSVEVKRSKLEGPPVRSAWIQQARRQGKREGKPWAVVVAGHNDRRPIMVLDFWEAAELMQRAGVIHSPFLVENVDAGEAEPVGGP